MNKVELIGRLCADPKLRYVGSKQTARCTMRLAVNRRFANAQGVREADFFTIIVWQKTAENAARYLMKGSQTAVVGTLQTRSYEAQDGTKRYVTEVIADEVEFLSSGTKEQGSGDAISQAQEAFGAEFVQVEDDELPF